MRGSLRLIGMVAAAFVAAVAHAARPPEMAPTAQQADRIHVDKSERRMDLIREGRVLKRYAIRLGDAPVGHKHRQGDERTPEGDYRIDGRNPGSPSTCRCAFPIPMPTIAGRRAHAG